VNAARGSARLVAGIRLALVMVAAGAAVAAAVVGAGGGAREVTVFVCPMHAEVRARAPASCPICGMALERVGARPAPAAVVDTTAVENVRKHRTLDFVRKHALLPTIRELRGPAWVAADGAVVALLYDDQIAALAQDETASFAPSQDTPAAPAPPAVVVRRTGEPPESWDASTSRVRFRAGAKSPPRAGAVGWLSIAPKARDVVGVPSPAVAQSPEGPYVLVADGAGGYVRRPIRIGETFLKQGFAVVLDGVREHERVAARATFFLDAERKLAASRSEGRP
jgi:hypothetical protein